MYYHMLVMKHKQTRPYRLSEIIGIVAIVAILFLITFQLVNPFKKFELANDTKRMADIGRIALALKEYQMQTHTNLHKVLPSTLSEIGKGSHMSDLCSILIPKYISILPSDPTIGKPINTVPFPCPSTYNTGYKVYFLKNVIYVQARLEANGNFLTAKEKMD